MGYNITAKLFPGPGAQDPSKVLRNPNGTLQNFQKFGASCGLFRCWSGLGRFRPVWACRGAWRAGKRALRGERGPQRCLFGIPKPIRRGYGTPTGSFIFSHNLVLVAGASLLLAAAKRAGSPHCPNNRIAWQQFFKLQLSDPDPNLIALIWGLVQEGSPARRHRGLALDLFGLVFCCGRFFHTPTRTLPAQFFTAGPRTDTSYKTKNLPARPPTGLPVSARLGGRTSIGTQKTLLYLTKWSMDDRICQSKSEGGGTRVRRNPRIRAPPPPNISP